MQLIDTLNSHVPIDQIYFICAQFSAFLYAFIFRKQLSSSLHRRSHISRTTLHLSLIIPGLIFTYMCFGFLLIHLILLAILSYLLITFVSPKWVHFSVLTLAMGYLSCLHVNRIITHSTSYSVEITAPIMIMVQKVTIIAFCLHDGLTSRYELLSPEQKYYSIRKRPSFLEYCAYVFDFQTIICGPLAFYVDFEDYLNGTKLKKIGLKDYPSVASCLLRKLCVCLICSILILFLVPIFPVTYLKDPSYIESSFLWKLFTVYLIALCARLKYYFAWCISESVCNASGLGFNGIDPKTERPKWNLMTNIDILGFENALNQRDSILCWNITTEKWLRKVAYERAPEKFRVLLTYILSAVWHGFYPGYYLTFLTGTLFTLASRNGRRCFRFRFKAMGHNVLMFYHSLTWFMTRIFMSYMAIPFILLEFHSSIHFFQNLYFSVHIVAVFAITVLPIILKPEPKAQNSTTNGVKQLNGTQHISHSNGSTKQ